VTVTIPSHTNSETSATYNCCKMDVTIPAVVFACGFKFIATRYCSLVLMVHSHIWVLCYSHLCQQHNHKMSSCNRCASLQAQCYLFWYISNEMQLYTIYFIWKLLCMFRMVPPPIIRSAKQLYLQHLVLVTPQLLSAAIVEELELHPQHTQTSSNSSTLEADARGR